MNDCLKITNIQKNKNRIDYCYEMEGKWNKLLNADDKMFIEYDIDIEDVPDSLCVIPLLCNILPISWVFNLSIEVENLDKEFYDCIPDIKKGYEGMYPKLEMYGSLNVKKLEENHYTPENSGVLFSGGVDAFNTLFQNIDEKPTLLTLWGADITLEDKIGWEKVSSHHISIANQYCLKYSFIKTNFRTFLNYANLTRYVAEKINAEWWHEFQHGIGILGHIAPIAYKQKYKNLYIASSYTADFIGKYTCASDPTIDNYLRFASCKTIHDGYEFSRQDKVHNICQYLDKIGQKSIDIRVCWQSSGGDNCCECEKCYRTIMAIITEKKDPCNFGFNFTPQKRAKMVKKLPKYAKYLPELYAGIQKKFIENYSVEETPKDLMWFRTFKFKHKEPIHRMLIKKLKIIVKKVIKEQI